MLPLFAGAQADSVYKKEDSVLVAVQTLNINSRQSDFAPFRHGNRLYFVSGRTNQMVVQYANQNNDTEITDIYEADATDPKKVRSVKAVEKVNTKYHEGPAVVSRDGHYMYLTSSDKTTQRLK